MDFQVQLVKYWNSACDSVHTGHPAGRGLIHVYGANAEFRICLRKPDSLVSGHAFCEYTYLKGISSRMEQGECSVNCSRVMLISCMSESQIFSTGCLSSPSSCGELKKCVCLLRRWELETLPKASLTRLRSSSPSLLFWCSTLPTNLTGSRLPAHTQSAALTATRCDCEYGYT